MNSNRASRTAESVAVSRTRESVKPEDERVCYDPYAKYFLGPRYRIIGAIGPLKRYMRRKLEQRMPGLFGAVVARTRYIDDYLKTRMADGIEQLVILGAGYDARAYRFEELKNNVGIFEVDHPETQKIKKEKLKKIFGRLPGHVTFVPVRFNSQRLSDRLYKSGYVMGLKTLFILEGVSYYITAGAMDDTLSFVADNSSRGSSIIFDYFPPSVVNGSSELKEAGELRKFLAKVDEEFQFGIEPDEIEEYLTQRGFHHVKNVDADYCKRLYFRGLNAGRNVSAMFWFVHATVNGDR